MSKAYCADVATRPGGSKLCLFSNPIEPRGSEDTIIKTDDTPKKMRDKRMFVCRLDYCLIMS